MQDYHYCRHLRQNAMLLFFIVALFDFHAAIATAEYTAVVNTTTGPVQGIILETVDSVRYAAFKGIPFAEPPLGYNRFKPPIPIKPWTTTLNATVEGPDCTQTVSRFNHIPLGSEDCLFINVYTTTTNLSVTPTELKSVMVWIYGGAFTTGSSSSEKYHPDYLLQKGVVYVAFNYRLGPLGFLSLNHKNATGNAGLKDQLLALKWTKANIAKFGGNPNNVTIFGQSAGSASVGFHIISDSSKGLFQAGISMSGVPLNPWALHSPLKSLSRAVLLGSLLGTDSLNKDTLLKTFYAATADELVIAASKISLAILAFAPTIENEDIATEPFLTRCSLAKYRTGNFTKVPQMMGFEDDEIATYTVALQPLFDIVDEATDAANNIGISLPTSLNPLRALINAGKQVVDKLLNTTLYTAIEEITDLLFIAQIDLTQQYLSAGNNGDPLYYYHISFYTNRSLHNLQSNSTILGPGHGDDLAYIFYYPKANYSNDPLDPTRQTIDRVSTMWTNFAKYGNPTPSWRPEDSVGITWPNSGTSGRSLNIGRELSVGSRPTNANSKFIQSASRLKFFATTRRCY